MHVHEAAGDDGAEVDGDDVGDTPRACRQLGDESGIEEVVQAARQLDPAFVSPARVLSCVVEGALARGHDELARRRAIEFVERLETVPDDAEMRARMLHDIAEALVTTGQKDAAAAICAEAFPLRRRCGSPVSRTSSTAAQLRGPWHGAATPLTYFRNDFLLPDSWR